MTKSLVVCVASLLFSALALVEEPIDQIMRGGEIRWSKIVLRPVMRLNIPNAEWVDNLSSLALLE
ncbi:MAG: hypothetical protein OSB26_13945 [Woeseiaceae bacterium]|jgi:hypothetical protein|nr:hypothetical protein [Woeseiaceae bacterium]